MGSPVVKGLLMNLIEQNICGHICIVGDYSTHLRRTGVTVWLGSVLKGLSNLKLTCVSESGPVLLMP